VEGVEIWDLPVAGRSLHSWRHAPEFPARLAEAVACTRTRIAPLSIARIFILGGGADETLCTRLRLALDVPCESLPTPRTAAVRVVGESLVHQGFDTIDIGQTSIKGWSCGHGWLVGRDLAQAPLRDEVPPTGLPGARTRTLAYFVEVLRSHTSVERPVLLALPCEVDDAGALAGCSYSWQLQDPSFLTALAESAKLNPMSLVCNDAELAALAVGLAKPQKGLSLILTCGFSIGAAWLAQ
jgi:hypothetical protein